MITQDRLKEVLDYNPDTGVFVYKISTAHRIKVGQVAGYNHGRYLRIKIDGGDYYLHRIAWLYVHGRFPALFLDHINTDCYDNRICNLREVSDSQNKQNIRKANSVSSTGLLGVSVHKASNKFVAQININGEHRYIGLYKTAQEAHEAYVSEKRKIHPFSTL
jgi:hypothetical protein